MYQSISRQMKLSRSKKGLRGDVDSFIQFLASNTKIIHKVRKVYKKRGVLTIEGELHFEK